MEQIREVALAYYVNSSYETKEMAKKFFQSMDTDGNGKVSANEFEEYVKGKWRKFKPELFLELDHNGDGFLDFEKVVVFYYMVNLRNSFCDGCGIYLTSLYFTCVNCFLKKPSNQTYDLCLGCYRGKMFSHPHSTFLDNYAMLTSVWSGVKLKEESQGDAIKAAGKAIRFGSEAIGFGSDFNCLITGYRRP